MMKKTLLKLCDVVSSAGRHRCRAEFMVFPFTWHCAVSADGAGRVVFCQHAVPSFSEKFGVWRNGSARHDEISDDPRGKCLTGAGRELGFPCRSLARRIDDGQAMESDG